MAEWDSPVLPVKESNDPNKLDDIDITEDVDLKNINIGIITINKTTEVIKQVNYRQSDKLASQVLMVFVNDWTLEGTITLYGSPENIPEDWKFGGKYAKREFLFTSLIFIFMIMKIMLILLVYQKKNYFFY